jgi:hypothetical protein
MSEPWAKLEIAFRDALPFLSSGEVKVWIAYLLRANKQREAWPGLNQLCHDTGLSRSRVSQYRNSLVEKGGLVQVGKARGENGIFGSPRFRVCIPNRDSKTRHGENAVRQKHGTAKSSFTVTRKRDAPCRENETRSRTNEVEPEGKKEKRYDAQDAKTASWGHRVSSHPPAVLAVEEAFQKFGGDGEAFNLVLWVLYRAAKPKEPKKPQIPQTLDYYTTSAENFNSQHEEWGDRVLENSVERFQKHAGAFVKEKCPELFGWLDSKWKELQAGAK